MPTKEKVDQGKLREQLAFLQVIIAERAGQIPLSRQLELSMSPPRSNEEASAVIGDILDTYPRKREGGASERGRQLTALYQEVQDCLNSGPTKAEAIVMLTRVAAELKPRRRAA